MLAMEVDLKMAITVALETVQFQLMYVFTNHGQVNLTSSARAAQTSATSSSPTSASGTYDSSVPTSNVQSSNPSSSNSAQPFRFPPAYPKVLKIEERRVPGDQSIVPY